MNDIEPIYITVGRNIKALREQAGITQQVLAEYLGMERTSVTNMEAGRQRMMLHDLQAIANVFSMPLTMLFAEIELPTAEQTDTLVSAMLRTRFRQYIKRLKHTVEEIEEEMTA